MAAAKILSGWGLVIQKPVRHVPVGLLILLMVVIPAFAQEQQSANDIVAKMQHDLNLSDDQVANITPIIDRYMAASADLQKSTDDGTINPSAIDSQKQQIKAVKDQGIAQNLRPDQLTQWNYIQGQDQKDKDTNEDDTGENDTGTDEYSNLPRNNPS